MKKFYIAKSRRLRSTPYTSRIENHGVIAYTTYNHMLLPASFGNLEKEYFHLKEHVQVWDVAAERQVQIIGKDSSKLVQLMTCRNLSKAKIRRCYYAPIIDEQGRMLNDPVALKLDDDKWWLSIADSDIALYAKGIASGLGLQVEITEPDVNILAVQGPKSFKLMEKILGKEITKLKFFGFDYYTFKGNKYLIARSGWSKQGGYEVYVDNRQAGQNLYDELFLAGKEFEVKPGCPNLIERIESGLLSAGNDFDSTDNPYECGFDKYIDIDSDINYLGKKALIKISKEGINRKLMGVLIDTDKIEVTESATLYNSNAIAGDLRSATYSPNLKKAVGIAMVKKKYWDKKNPLELKIGDKKSIVTLCDLPIVTD
jgi:dimethylsulfoniopropionate demethylase